MDTKKPYLPHFEKYISHLSMFGDLFALKPIWEIIELTHGNKDSTPYTDSIIEQWETLVTLTSQDLFESASMEIEQFVCMANPFELEALYSIVKVERENVDAVLSKKAITNTISEYNKNPEPLMKKDVVEQSEWIVTNDKFILNPDYIDYYLESLVNLHLLPYFHVLTDRVLRVFELRQKATLIFDPSDDSFESHIVESERVRLNNIIERMTSLHLVEKVGPELRWQGIQGSNLGSAAAMARYLEKAGVMSGFVSMTKAREAYCTKFNISQSDQKEWNKIYRTPKSGEVDGLRFNENNGLVEGASDYWDQLSFIFDI